MFAAFSPLITERKTYLRSCLLFCWQKLFKIVNFELENAFPTRGWGNSKHKRSILRRVHGCCVHIFCSNYNLEMLSSKQNLVFSSVIFLFCEGPTHSNAPRTQIWKIKFSKIFFHFEEFPLLGSVYVASNDRNTAHNCPLHKRISIS